MNHSVAQSVLSTISPRPGMPSGATYTVYGSKGVLYSGKDREFAVQLYANNADSKNVWVRYPHADAPVKIRG